MSGDEGASGDSGSEDGTSGGNAGSAKWRCAWCEKPHDRNDPPCDNCGHHKFERAVVPVAPTDPDHEREPVWVCPECGRQHQRNSPPCSRCGSATLEKRVPDDEDFTEELSGTSYLDVLEPIYVVGIVFAVVAGGVLVLGLLGVVSLPGMGGDSLSVSNVPGNATTAGGLSLAEVEDEYVAVVEDRTDRTLTRDDGLDDVARFYNQRRVKAELGEGTLPGRDRLREAIPNSCQGNASFVPFPLTSPGESGVSEFESERALARELVTANDAGSALSGDRIGVDVHLLPDGRVAVTQFSCRG